jgi:hypothetical protein
MALRWRRYLRRSPAIAWREFWHPILNRGQMLQGLIATIGIRLALFTSSLPERIQLASEWGAWIQAFGIACLIWAILSALRAPFVAHAEDRVKGSWVSPERYILFQPMLVGMFRSTASDQMQTFSFRVPFAEPGSLVDLSLDFEPPGTRKRAAIWLNGGWPSSHVSLGDQAGESRGLITGDEFRMGIRLPAENVATLYVRLDKHTVATHIKVYCQGFQTGKGQVGG